MNERYDQIGVGYACTRREDPDLRARVHAALGAAQSVLNVGAGSGSYEPTDRRVVAVEPSAVMVAQRGPDRAPAVRARAEQLPFADDSVDAGLAVLTLHHWDRGRREGVQELRRVVRGSVVIVTYDPEVSGAMWLMRDYLHEVAAMDRAIFPAPEEVAWWLGGGRIETVRIGRDTPDWSLGSFWAHPERVLDPQARRATSGFARQPAEVVERVVAAVRRDLQDGTWERRNPGLRGQREFDAGLRLIVGPPKDRSE